MTDRTGTIHSTGNGAPDDGVGGPSSPDDAVPDQVIDNTTEVADDSAAEDRATKDTSPMPPVDVGEKRRRGVKFLYPSGSRPLSDYTIKRGIGAGGFGEVYYATSDAGKEVALKHIQRNLDVELRGVKQCLNLKHTNLIALYDIKFDDEERAWVVMEYVSGECLQDAVERNPSGMPLAEVIRWFEGIAAGVSYLHDHGIVHRDLKPGNLFLDDTVVKIGDYGLSKFISCSRRSGQTESVGTFHYMAPEIGRGTYGKEIDIYALGIILYEMLTGNVPFDGESSQEIIMKHLTASPDLTRLPAKLRGVVAAALQKDPEQRLTSVDTMLAEFRRLVDDPDAEPTVELASDDAAVGVAAVLSPEPPLHDVSHSNTHAANISVEPSNSSDEPVAMAIRELWCAASNAWHRANLGTISRFILLLVAVFLLLSNAYWLIPFGLLVGFAYTIYLLLRGALIGPDDANELDSVEARRATLTSSGEQASANASAGPFHRKLGLNASGKS